jgi:uncharacterized protein YuzE
MPRLPIAVERETEYNAAYVRYREQEPQRTGRTIGYADCQVNVDVDVDVDEADQIIGIEILSLSADELAALAEIAKDYDLDLSPLIGGAVPNAA